MKKNKILLSILLISFITFSQAGAACLIKDKPAPALSEYIKNNRLVIKNITNSIVDSKNKKDTKDINEKNNSSKFQQLKTDITDEYNQTSSEISSIFNETFNFTGYFSYFKYFVTYPISNEVPYEVKRDYSKLDNESKGMTQYFNKLNSNGDSDFIVENPCKGVTIGLEKCEEILNNQKTTYIIGKLIQNNDKILDLYRNSVIGSDNDYDIENFIIVDEDFIDQIQFKYYSETSIGKCNEEKGGFFEKITTAISDIKLINKKGRDGIQKWKDAFALLIGNSPDGEEDKIAEQQLKEYLSNSGLPTDKQEIIMKNLADTESNPFSLNNNFIEKTFSSTNKKLKKDLALWKKQNIGDAVPKTTEKISIDEIKNITNNSDITRNIEKSIDEMYESEIPFIGVSNITTETLRAKIINSHVNLQNSIETLEKTIGESQKVCRAQGGGGKCD